MVVVLGGKSAVDVSQSGADAILVALEGFQVDRVGEVRGQQLVALGLEAFAVRGQFSQFLGAGREAFIERRINLGGEIGVLGLGDRDVAVAVLDQLFSDPDGDGATGAVLAFGGAAGADVVGVADALPVRGVVQLHP
ncbi:hypothetical protein [Micropruina sp.]|uniref:hypothetical protein n=1 Tax=Micropruina sp. TaxID=2737536 RepID=UPI0039E3E679